MLEYQIRPATIDDLSTILYHRRRMYEDMGHKDARAIEAVLVYATPLLRRCFEEGTYHGWLVETQGIGIVAGGGIIFLDFQANPRDPQPKRPWVVNMFTEPEHRRHGLGRRLMETMLEWCRAQGMKTLYLHASNNGRHLYESLGFKPTNEMMLSL